MAISLGFSPGRSGALPFRLLPGVRDARGGAGRDGPPTARGSITGAGSRTRTKRMGTVDLRPITLLQPRRGYTPDFLAPPPAARLRTSKPNSPGSPRRRRPSCAGRSRCRSARLQGAQDTELGRLLLGDPAEVLGFLTYLVRAAWRALVEPVWPRVRALRPMSATAHGAWPKAALTACSPTLTRRCTGQGDSLVREPGGDEHVDLGGRGVLLMPSVFKWEEAIVITQPPWQPTISYPARGLGDLWAGGRGGPRPRHLRRGVGRTRASLAHGA